MYQHRQGFVLELMGTTYATFSTGEDYKCIQVYIKTHMLSWSNKSTKFWNDFKHLNPQAPININLQFRNVAESEEDVPYGYGFFHFVFAMGSMYFGMLFVGWDTHHMMMGK
jgi:hypothetical protein